jgi:hypothetical protein
MEESPIFQKNGDAPIMWPFKNIQNCGGIDD